jgi:hypothetical protein
MIAVSNVAKKCDIANDVLKIKPDLAFENMTVHILCNFGNK